MRSAVLLFVIFSTVSVCSAAVITVDDDGSAGFNNIQDAIDFADYGDTVQVAEGTYVENITLKNGVALIGAGEADTIIDGNDNGSVVTSINCDPNTILDGFTITNGSGTIGDDGYTYGSGMYNNQSNPTVINCTFSGNIAFSGGLYFLSFGGGMYNDYSSPTVTNCTFSGNYAYYGGGIDNISSSPKVTNCAFSGNLADCGGGMYNQDNSNSMVTSCTFSGNRAHTGGGGMFNNLSSPIIDNCIFSSNSAFGHRTTGEGGGISNYWYSSPIVINCVFRNNISAMYGGGMCNRNNCSPMVVCCIFTGNSIGFFGGGMCNRNNCSPMVVCCIFTGNSIGFFGGGMYNDFSSTTLINCTFYGNIASIGDPDPGSGSGGSGGSGGGMYNQYNCSPIVTNCIIWGNIADDGTQILGDNSIITYSDVEGGWPGEGNNYVDPCFADPGYWDPNGTPADPSDDFWVEGDFHLQSQAGRWDANSQGWVTDDVTSPCIDAGDWMTAVGFEPFPNGGRVNMGAYGRTIEASKSYFGTEPCETIIAGDINGDCKVDFADFAIMSLHWLEDARPID